MATVGLSRDSSLLKTHVLPFLLKRTLRFREAQRVAQGHRFMDQLSNTFLNLVNSKPQLEHHFLQSPSQTSSNPLAGVSCVPLLLCVHHGCNTAFLGMKICWSPRVKVPEGRSSSLPGHHSFPAPAHFLAPSEHSAHICQWREGARASWSSCERSRSLPVYLQRAGAPWGSGCKPFLRLKWAAMLSASSCFH